VSTPDPGDPLCGDDPHEPLPPDIPSLGIFDPNPVLPCPPMPTRALGPQLSVDPATVEEAAVQLHRTCTALHYTASGAEQRLLAVLPGLGALRAPLGEGQGDLTRAIHQLADNVGRLAEALTAVLRSYAELEGTPGLPERRAGAARPA